MIVSDNGTEFTSNAVLAWQEELGIDISAMNPRFFTEFTFDFGCLGHGVVYRRFYVVDVGGLTVGDFVLGEGQGLRYVNVADALNTLSIVPYDAFALWMYSVKAQET